MKSLVPPPAAGAAEVAGAPNGLGAAPAGGPKGDWCLPNGVLAAAPDPNPPPDVPPPNAGAGAGALPDGAPKGEGAGALDAAAPNGDGLGALLPKALLLVVVDPNA